MKELQQTSHEVVHKRASRQQKPSIVRNRKQLRSIQIKSSIISIDKRNEQSERKLFSFLKIVSGTDVHIN